MLIERGRSQPWWATAYSLTVGLLALALAQFGPNLFSDPNGVDPDGLRLAFVGLALAAISLGVANLRASRAVLLALAAIASGYSAWLLIPDILLRATPGHSGWFFGLAVLCGAVVQLALTAILAAIALRHAVTPPRLRLRSLGGWALVAALVGVALLILLALAVPAQWLGREGLAPIAIARNAWLYPADALQGTAQELQFRGLLLGSLEAAFSPRLANLVQASVFGLAHLAIVYQGPGLPFVPITFAVGWALGWLTQRTGSLWPAILIHALADIGVDLVVTPGLYGY